MLETQEDGTKQNKVDTAESDSAYDEVENNSKTGKIRDDSRNDSRNLSSSNQNAIEVKTIKNTDNLSHDDQLPLQRISDLDCDNNKTVTPPSQLDKNTDQAQSSNYKSIEPLNYFINALTQDGAANTDSALKSSKLQLIKDFIQKLDRIRERSSAHLMKSSSSVTGTTTTDETNDGFKNSADEIESDLDEIDLAVLFGDSSELFEKYFSKTLQLDKRLSPSYEDLIDSLLNFDKPIDRVAGSNINQSQLSKLDTKDLEQKQTEHSTTDLSSDENSLAVSCDSDKPDLLKTESDDRLGGTSSFDESASSLSENFNNNRSIKPILFKKIQEDQSISDNGSTSLSYDSKQKPLKSILVNKSKIESTPTSKDLTKSKVESTPTSKELNFTEPPSNEVVPLIKPLKSILVKRKPNETIGENKTSLKQNENYTRRPIIMPQDKQETRRSVSTTSEDETSTCTTNDTEETTSSPTVTLLSTDTSYQRTTSSDVTSTLTTISDEDDATTASNEELSNET